MQTVASRAQAADAPSGISAADAPLPDHDTQRAARERQILGAVVVALTAGIAVMAACGNYAFIWKTAVIPLLLLAAFASRRVNHFVADWSVFLGLIILFDFLRGFIFALVSHFELPVYMHYAIDWDRWLCGGYVPPVVLQQWRAGLTNPEPLDRLFTIVHGSHFAFFLVFGLALWLLRPAAFRRYAAAMVLLAYLGLALYLLVPTVPPWMAAESFGVLAPIEHVTAHMYNSEIPSLHKALDVNPIAAMPSLHAAMPTLCMLAAFYHFGRRGWWVAAYTGLALFGVVYLGEHYVVDVAAGVVLAAAAFALVHAPRREPSASPRWTGARRPALVAALLIVVAELVGAVTLGLDRRFAVTEPFARRELVGRTPLAHLHLGRLALQRGDLASAREELQRASLLLDSAAQRQYAAILLAQAQRSGSPPPVEGISRSVQDGPRESALQR